jgi:hypothetical protein
MWPSSKYTSTINCNKKAKKMKITAFQDVPLSSFIDRYQCPFETLVPIYKTARRHTPAQPKSGKVTVDFW